MRDDDLSIFDLPEAECERRWHDRTLWFCAGFIAALACVVTLMGIRA